MRLRIKIIGSYLKFQTQEECNAMLAPFLHKREEYGVYGWEEFDLVGPLDAGPCDAVLVINNVDEKREIIFPPENLFALMQESFYQYPLRVCNSFLINGLSRYRKVISPIAAASNVILSHGHLGWSFRIPYRELLNMTYPEKHKLLSTVTSDMALLPGHRLRLKFIEQAKRRLEIDHFGRGVQEIKDKWDGIYPYQYSIAIENTSIPYYFTEKITDCFVAFTIPFYYGCTNIEKFFPKDAFIPIDITRPDYAIDKIRDVLKNERPADRKDALLEAREYALKKCAIGSAIDLIAPYVNRKAPKKTITLTPVRPSIKSRIVNKTQHIAFSIWRTGRVLISRANRKLPTA